MYIICCDFTRQQTNGPYLCEMRMRPTYDKFVKVLGFSIEQFCNSYDSKVLAVTFHGRHIQVIIWITAGDTVCKLKREKCVMLKHYK